jgi:hypothetical protein
MVGRIAAVLLVLAIPGGLGKRNLRNDQELEANRPQSTLRMFAHDCGMKVHGLALTQETNPGAGMHPESIEPYKIVTKDGYMHVDCIKDQLFEYGDKFGKNKHSYNVHDTYNVSIVRYTDIVAKEDREEMSPTVCFRFCRSVPDMEFFGLIHGRDCYCSPFYKMMAGDSSDCDEVCEGSPTEMCGGKTKSSVFAMHLCQDTKEELEAATGRATFYMAKADTLVEAAGATAEGMQDAGAEMQEVFGKVGDPVASDLMQVTKQWAGELQHAVEGLEGVVKVLDGYAAEAGKLDGADFSDSSKIVAAEDVIGKFDAETDDAKAKASKAMRLYNQATRGLGRAHEYNEYYPLMYFVDKDYVDTPTTCGGDWDQHTLFGVTVQECAAACDAEVVKPECVGFSYYESGLCFLFSKFKSVTYYAGCAEDDSKKKKVKAFIEHAANRSRQPLLRDPEPASNDCTGGYAKLDFSNAELGESNLPSALEYKNVGQVDGKSIDVVISANSFEPPNDKKKVPGLKGNMPYIIFQFQSKTKLTFTFKDSATKEPVTLCSFDFAVFDMDNPKNGQIQERITIGDFEQVFMADNQQYTTFKQKDGRSTFTAVSQGSRCDNPDDAFNLRTVTNKKCVKNGEVVQAERSVAFRFSEKSSFDVEVNMKCVERSGECDKSQNRQLMFGFSSDMAPPPTTTTPSRDFTTTTAAPKPKGDEAPTMCFAKLEDFVGTNLNPNQDMCKNGKNKLCLKEATKADRCYK